ncbi:hypothetical protein ACVWW4_000249 [Bradyrhizobium sp. LB7.1]
MLFFARLDVRNIRALTGSWHIQFDCEWQAISLVTGYYWHDHIGRGRRPGFLRGCSNSAQSNQASHSKHDDSNHVAAPGAERPNGHDQLIQNEAARLVWLTHAALS